MLVKESDPLSLWNGNHPMSKFVITRVGLFSAEGKSRLTLPSFILLLVKRLYKLLSGLLGLIQQRF
jgi:hypothetical protein